VKGRIFDAMDEAAADDGSTVRAAFERILEDHPQIRG
jgi:hypothetical protein